MKRILVVVALACGLALTANAAEGGKKHQMTDEQKALQKEMIEKYDANKDGKLDKDEKAKMSKEDKQKWNKAFGHEKEGKKEHKSDESK